MYDDQDGCEWVSFFQYRPTRVVPDQRPLDGCMFCLKLTGYQSIAARPVSQQQRATVGTQSKCL